ncbi:MAG: hypothetical protein IJY94_04205 [Clostridia bacterium]|nr:hypothetical protein [Clostridia bacterium]
MKVSKHVKKIEEMILFALFGAIMYLTAQIDIVPNMHPLTLFIAAFTVVYRFKALIPIYIYVFLEGLMGGFGIWWYPNLYIWTFLWLLVMLIPKNLNEVAAGIIITVLSTLHGIGFGLLYMPYQCYVFFKGNWDFAYIWLLNGLPFDVLHALGNLVSSLLTIPLVLLLCKLGNYKYPFKRIKTKRNG